jgi:hypothetical protein
MIPIQGRSVTNPHEFQRVYLENEKHPNNNKLMTDGVSGDGIFPVVTVRVNDIMCRALIDSGTPAPGALRHLPS